MHIDLCTQIVFFPNIEVGVGQRGEVSNEFIR